MFLCTGETEGLRGRLVEARGGHKGFNVSRGATGTRTQDTEPGSSADGPTRRCCLPPGFCSPRD
jgi:hypothetical protein